MVTNCHAHARAPGLCLCRWIFLVCRSHVALNCGWSDLLADWAGGACGGFRTYPQKFLTCNQRSLCLYQESSLPRLGADGTWICYFGTQLVDRDVSAGNVPGDLYSGDQSRGSVPARNVPRLCGIRRECAPSFSAAGTVPDDE